MQNREAVGRRVRSVFASAADLDRYLDCYFDTDRSHAPVALHVPAIGPEPIYLRPGTTDARVLDDTFVGLYHLPPGELSADSTILDLGANIGLVARHYAQLYPRSTIACVELDAGNVEMLRRNVACLADRVRVIHAAAWTRDEPVAYVAGEEWGLHVRMDGALGLGGEDAVNPHRIAEARERARHAASAATLEPTWVQGLSVETILDRVGFDRVSLAKVDVEGAEAEIVTPGRSWLRRCDSAHIEVHPPATVDTMQHALRDAGLRAWKDTKHPSCAVGVR
jgi:FkbM family methyltransferase